MSILSKLGLMKEKDFWARVHQEFGERNIRVIEGRQHELLIDIAATAGILLTDPTADDIRRRLTIAIQTYKIVEQDQNIPPSTIRREEVTMMEYPGR